MTKQVFDRETRTWVPAEDYYAAKAPEPRSSDLPCPQVMGDIAEYVSPLGTGLVTSRSHRREELKRHGCREVDPSEHKPKYINPKNKARAENARKASS